jgi:hypothetical protein
MSLAGAAVVAGMVGMAPPASAGQPPAVAARAAWARTGRPARLVVVRPNSVDLIAGGSLIARVFRLPGQVTLSWLAGTILSGGWAGTQQWVSRPGDDTIRLSAALLLARGTDFVVDSSLHQVQLVGGAKPAETAWIRGGQADLTVNGVELTSYDPATGKPVAATAAGRPYIAIGAGGRLDIKDATVRHLDQVTWGKDSTGSADSTRFTDNRTGLRLVASTGVRLSDITVENSKGDGVVLRGDLATSMDKVTSRANGQYGVRVSGAGARTLNGVSTAGNGRGGVLASGQTDLAVHNVASDGDHGTGIWLNGCVRCTLGAATVNGASTGLAITGTSSDVRLAGIRIRGGRIGLRAAAPARGIQVGVLTVSGVADRGLALSASGVQVESTTVSGAGTGVRIYGGATRIRLTGVSVDKARKGIDVSDAHAAGTQLDVLAEKVGVKVDRDARFSLSGSRVRAPLSLVGSVERSGHNTVTLPPFPWLGFIGVCALASGVMLEAIHRQRQHRRPGAVRIPAHVSNIS